MRTLLLLPALLLSAVALLAGCEAVDKPKMTAFQPLDGGGYRYEAMTDATYPENSPEAEATRLRWLEEYLGDGGYCPGGYTVEAREVEVVQTGFFADFKRITYTVACS